MRMTWLAALVLTGCLSVAPAALDLDTGTRDSGDEDGDWFPVVDFPEPEPIAACASARSPWSLVEAWRWEGWSADPEVHLVGHAPALGDVDGDGSLDVLFVATARDEDQGVLIALDGATGQELLAVPDVFGVRRMAVADVDDDGQVEAFLWSASEEKLLSIGGAGQRWELSMPRCHVSRIGLVDLDGDADPDVVTPCGSFDATDGTPLLGAPTIDDPAFVDANGDGQVEALQQEGLLALDGTALLTWDRFAGLAPLPGGGFFVKRADEGVVFDVAFQVVESFPLAYDSYPAALDVEDLDQDGLLEVAIPMEDHIAVWSLDGALRWSHEVPRDGPSASVAAIHDLDGDGCQELVWPQNAQPRVYDAATGELLVVDETELGAPTNDEERTPIADLDGDGSLDLLLHNDGEGTHHVHGVRMFSEAQGAWTGAPEVP